VFVLKSDRAAATEGHAALATAEPACSEAI
jgi:hypothetical protein